MHADRREVAERFRRMDDDELLAEADRAGELTDEAHAALRAVIEERGLSVPSVPAAVALQPTRWVTIERFRDLSSAIVARSALEAAEIPCYLRDENTVRLDWQLSNFIGGMRLDVPAEEQLAAEEMLHGLELQAEEYEDVHQPPRSWRRTGDRCAHCGSDRIHCERRFRRLALALLWTVSIPIPLGARQARCERCGLRWTAE